MCDCLTWVHPVWRAAAKIARCQPDTVFAVFSALEADGDRAVRLRPEILAVGLGRRAQVVERVLASLASLSVTCDGVVTQEWRRAPDGAAERPLSMKPSAVRMRRKRLLDRAAGERQDHEPEAMAAPPGQGVTCDGEAAPLLKEEDQDSLIFPSDVRKQARDPLAGGYGTQAEAAKKARAEKWLANTLIAAQERLSRDRFAKLYAGAYADPRPRWAQLELDRISALIKSPDPPRNPRQGWMHLPIAGGGAQPSGVTEEERVRRYRERARSA
jgi:hypothetical protein